MAYYNECPNCGASLDPGEKCDCQEKEKAPDVRPTQPGKAIHKVGNTHIKSIAPIMA